MEQMETKTIILDTDILILIDYFRGVEEAKDYIGGILINERATTDITLMELFKGTRNKCVDSGEPYTNGGTAVFEIVTSSEED